MAGDMSAVTAEPARQRCWADGLRVVSDVIAPLQLAPCTVMEVVLSIKTP